jgi:hypothetical protein
MADPVTLVLLVAAGEAASPATTAMTQGARDAVGGTLTEVRETPATPTDADALAAEGPSGPDAVAELIWRDADHRRSTLRVHLRQSRRWIERSFAFAASDPPAERGRTLGFAVASILPEVAAPGEMPPDCTPDANGRCVPGLASSPVSAPPSPPGPAPASAPVPRPAPGPALLRAPDATRSDSSADESPAPVNAEWLRDPRLGVDLLAAAATGIAGSAQTAGGGAALEWSALRWLALRFGAIERAGSLDVAQAHTSTLVTSAGIALRPWQPTRSKPFSVSLRADYILVRESATHFDSDDPSPVTEARWVSGIDTFLDGGWLLSSQIGAVVGVGLEDVGSPTYVFTKDVRVATIPVLRAVAEAGFQLRF